MSAQYHKAKLRDPDYKGEDYSYPTEHANGPLEDRKCTDVLFLLVFILFCGAMGFSAMYGYKNGQPLKLFAPLDAEGNICGFDQGYEDYKFMYIWDFNNAVNDPKTVFQSAVCVKNCPRTEMKNNQTVLDIQCKWIPYMKGRDCDFAPVPYGSVAYIGYYCIPDPSDLNTELLDRVDSIITAIAEGSAGRQVADLVASWKVLAASIGIALLVSILYCILLRTFAKALAWVSIVAIFAALLGLGMLFYNHKIQSSYEILQAKNQQLVGVVIWGLSGLYVLAILCYWKSLNAALNVIEQASEFVGQNIRIIIVPVIFFMIQVSFFIVWLVGSTMVFSVGEIDNGPPGTQFKVVKWSTNTQYMGYFMIFGGLWGNAFIIACTQFVIIVACVTWYFSKNSDTQGHASILKGIWWIIRYHVGSLAFGSLIVAIFWAIRIIFEGLAAKAKAEGGNSAPVKILICMCRCCISCVDRFVRYINRNAYIQVAVTSEPFCTSALTSFLLILKNSAKFGFLAGIGNIFLLLGKLVIALVTSLIAFLILKGSPDIQVQSPTTPIIAVFLVSYAVGTIFVSVFTVSANTIMQCYLIEIEVHGESKAALNDKAPNFMS